MQGNEDDLNGLPTSSQSQSQGQESGVPLASYPSMGELRSSEGGMNADDAPLDLTAHDRVTPPVVHVRDTGVAGVSDEDRLPWLEAVDDRVPATGRTGKTVGFLTAGLLSLAIVVGGVSLLRQRTAPTGDGRLITAQAGDYKVRPDAPGGMKVEGQGDSAFAASEGAEANGKIDLNGGSEAPVAKPGKTANATPVTAPAKSLTAALPSKAATLTAMKPAAAATSTAAAPAGSMVQLAAYSSEAKANEAWVGYTKRFAYLAPLTKAVERADVNGKAVYRLRANAGDDAAGVCGKLKVAGETCLVVN